MLLLLDNYDSFTYNIYQMLIEHEEVVVLKNNDPFLAELERPNLKAVVLSPGPGLPKTAGNLMSFVQKSLGRFPTLGVCLGHQALGLHFGAKLVRSKEVFHGRPSLIYHSGLGIFSQIKSPFSAIRYHSWLLDRDSIPEHVEVTAWTSTGEVMGIQSKAYPNVFGIQFHPESALTESGDQLVRNFLTQAKA